MKHYFKCVNKMKESSIKGEQSGELQATSEAKTQVTVMQYEGDPVDIFWWLLSVKSILSVTLSYNVKKWVQKKSV